VEPDLAARLRGVGLDPAAPGDPGEAWHRLHERFGPRATLIDRYALEAAARAVPVEDLAPELRERVTREVLEAHEPGFEIIASSGRARRDPIEVVDYDPAWPARFEIWRERLARALGPVARRIDHVGSTSVPGLAAKPVIDVQLSVPDVRDEAAYVPRIERAGVGFRSRDDQHRYFRPTGDRPREVQIHVCTVGSPWERRHLLFRDFLRADVDTRDAYAALKRELAARYRHDRIAYNESKTGFILDAIERAEAWDDAGRPSREPSAG
jgi:GrpB-like predicted nucleotidyltransferase (UPF0157 family)